VIPHVLASNGDLALKNSVHLPKQKSLVLRVRLETLRARSPKIGILPGESTNIPGPVQIYLNGLLTTESFCSAVGQHCQGQSGQDDKQNRITPGGGVKIGWRLVCSKVRNVTVQWG
jgi:hypothetical protein